MGASLMDFLKEISTGLPGSSKEMALISAVQHHPTWWADGTQR